MPGKDTTGSGGEASPTCEQQDVLSDLPAGMVSSQHLGGFYAYGADMPNPFGEQATAPLTARPSVDFRRSGDGRISIDFRRSMDLSGRKPLEIDRGVSGVIVHDLLHLTSDPRVKQRLMAADADGDGRISRKDILKVMSSEMSAKQKLKWGLISGALLLVICLLMLAANAALTYTVVRMSQETSVQSSGVLTDKSGDHVIGTGQVAGVVDLLYAHYTPAEASAALLSLKTLVVTNNNNTRVTVYQVLTASLVTGQHLEFVVAAPTAPSPGNEGSATSGGVQAVAELVRLVVDDEGVHELRDGPAGSSDGADAESGGRRRLLVAAPTGRPTLGVGATMRGVVYDVAAPSCANGVCGATTNQMSCPEVPTCGADGKLYMGPCAARAAGTSVRCTNCAPLCTGANSGRPVPVGTPGNVLVDSGGSYVRKPPPPSSAGGGGGASAVGAGNPAGQRPGNLVVDSGAYIRRPPPSRAIGGAATAANTKPAGRPGNLIVDSGTNYVRKPPSHAGNNGAAAASTTAGNAGPAKKTGGAKKQAGTRRLAQALTRDPSPAHGAASEVAQEEV